MGPANVVDFINEVEEELRKDDYNRLLKKYGPAIGAVLFLVVAGAGYMEYREYADAKKAANVSAIYTAADRELEAGDRSAAIASFTDLGETGPDGYGGLAFMRAATIHIEAGNTAAAIADLDRSAARLKAPRHKQLAQLKAAYLLADQGAFSDVVARTEPLAQNGEPYEYLARELLGFAHAEAGNASAAREQFSYLTTIPGVPATVKQRAEQSMALMNASAGLTAPEAVAPADSDVAPTDTETTDTSDEN